MKNKPAYLVSNCFVSDGAGMARYVEDVRPILEKYNGKVIVLERNVSVLEGSAAAPVLVLIEFPSIDDARNFYAAPEYQPIKQLRIDATEGGFLALAESL